MASSATAGIAHLVLSDAPRGALGAWSKRLRKAIEDGSFVLHYQPIFTLSDGSVSHYEALLRLADRPSGELTSPSEFLPAAESTGLIQLIDEAVLGEVVRLLGAQLSHRGTPVAVNLSGLSVTKKRTLRHIEALLEAHCVAPKRLIIELTETAAIRDMGKAVAFCEQVRALGCAIALDDFGAGFGSFRYLKRLPFDYLKIDGDFIGALPSSEKDQLVVQALVRVAKGLGKRTVAEYVGGPETVRLLREYGVDYGQGFGLGCPLAPREAFRGLAFREDSAACGAVRGRACAASPVGACADWELSL